MYGISREKIHDLTELGFDVVADLDVEGAVRVKAQFSSSKTIFLAPPSFEVLEQRMRKRGAMTEDEISGRLAHAHRETSAGLSFDHFITLNDVSTGVAQLRKLLSNL